MADSFVKIMDRAVQALIYAKFKTVMNLTDVNTDSVIWPRDVAFRKISEKRGRGVVEFFSLWRETMNFDWSRQRTAVARIEQYLAFTDAERTDIRSARAIPATLDYNVWFWTKDYDILQQISEEYMWWRHTDPNLNLNYDDTYPMEMDLHFGEAVDESAVEQMFDRGLYFVLRAPITVDAWLIKDFSVKTIKKIIISVYDETVEENPQLLFTETLILPIPPSGEE